MRCDACGNDFQANEDGTFHAIIATTVDSERFIYSKNLVEYDVCPRCFKLINDILKKENEQ